MKVRIHVINVYDVEIDTDDSQKAIDKANAMQSTEIEANGNFITAMTDHAEIEDEVKDNLKLLGN